MVTICSLRHSGEALGETCSLGCWYKNGAFAQGGCGRSLLASFQDFAAQRHDRPDLELVTVLLPGAD